MTLRTLIQIRKTSNEDLAEATLRINECMKRRTTALDLSNLGLRQIPPRVGLIPWLGVLLVSKNWISEVPDFIGELTELRTLALWANPIEVISPNVSRLKNLRVLSITEGAPSAADPVIGSLPLLNTLVLSGLGLETFPDWLPNLVNLETLYLQNNRFKDLPASLGKLNKLSYLNVQGNEFGYLPASLLNLKNLRQLYIDDIVGFPKEIIKEADAKTILDYYFRIKNLGGERQPLNEFKLILVGRGGVGKTTLVHRLTNGKYKEFKRTPGINITKWPVEIDGEEVQANVWDFGGQEIMHGTHRFFMTERALYLVLISGREGTEDHDAEYWLSLVRSFAGNVPVIVLLNKCDDYSFELNRRLLKEKYGRNLVFIETDSHSGTGITQLYEQIRQLAKRLPGLKASWPREWRKIKEVLPQKKRSWLTFHDFRDFCAKEGITDAKEQEILADSLHHLGLMLSYRKEDALRNFGVLNPQWVTRGIYQVLNSRVLREAQGEFTAQDFAEILPARNYPREVHAYLLALMRKFRLCHPDEKGETYLIPELLSKEEPDLDKDFPPEIGLGFEYRYDTVLPEGLLPRFIVETYFLKRLRSVWRTGVVLERANCRALVRGDVQGRHVVIRVGGLGHGRRELLGIIRDHFERIHESYETLPVTELVPIPGHSSVKVPYKDLLGYEAEHEDEYKILIDRKLRTFSVAALLDGVDIPGGRRVKEGQEWDRTGYSLFISYSHKDERFRDELRGALTAYERKGDLYAADDTCVVPGQQWEGEILKRLETADIVVLLLSNDFIRSDYCYVTEMQKARERDKAGECAIVPIVVRACAYEKLELGQLQAILPNGKPVKQNKDRDAAWLEVTNQLDRVIARLNKHERAS